MKTLFFAGFGDLAQHVLYQLALTAKEPTRFLIGTRNPENAAKFVNTCRFMALQNGFEHQFSIDEFNIHEPLKAVSILEDSHADFIFSTLSYRAWWINQHNLPESISLPLSKTELGPWLPMHLAPAYKFMQLVKTAGINCRKVVNAAFPDVVNPVLEKADLGPLCGIGNVANNVPGLQTVAAKITDNHINDIQIFFYAAHYVSNKLSRLGHVNKAPYKLIILNHGEDISHQFKEDQLFTYLAKHYPRLSGKEGQGMTAASACRVLSALLWNMENDILHVPGIKGLPGGYPAAIINNDLSVFLTPNIDLDEAEDINRNGLKFDGIQEITPQGEVLFEAKHINIMNEVIGWNHTSVSLSNIEVRAQELIEKVSRLENNLSI